MPPKTTTQSSSEAFNELAADPRLSRILGPSNNRCAIELWILQMAWASNRESRILYGRVLPSTFTNMQWNARADDDFQEVDEGLSAQVVRVSAFCTTGAARDFLEGLVVGLGLGGASAKAGIAVAPAFSVKFGNVSVHGPLSFRPTMHLPSRGYFRWATTRQSPTASASADSATIGVLTKESVFHLNDNVEQDLASFAITELNSLTGMDFAELDAWRLGDIELLVFPGLDAAEKPLFNVSGKPGDLTISLVEGITSNGTTVRVRVSFFNDTSLFHVYERSVGPTFPLDLKFAVPGTHATMIDAYEVVIEASVEGTSWLPLVCWGAHLARDFNIRMKIESATRASIDWLSVGIKTRYQQRQDAAQQISRDALPSPKTNKYRVADSWVYPNRKITSLLPQLVPRKSEGEFFLRYSEGDQTGRLELVEWLQKLLSEHRDGHLVWFDPFMEDVGVNLLNMYGFGVGNYIVLTCQAREERREDWVDRCYSAIRRLQGRGEKKPHDSSRTRNLISACESWSDRFGSVRLRVLALPEGTFHDRMILIRGAQGQPAVGFHLSNSIQRANENYPLLITPIPRDVLLKVADYTDQMVRNALPGEGGDGTTAESAGSVLFDSSARVPQRKAPASLNPILETSRSGEILGWWLGNNDLGKLSGRNLEAALTVSGVLVSGSLKGPAFHSLPTSFWTHGIPLANFNSAWDAMGVVLAHSTVGDNIPKVALPRSSELVKALYAFLDSDRQDAVQPPDRRVRLSMQTELHRPISELFRDVASLHSLFHDHLTEVSWGDYYAIKILWLSSASTLVQWIQEGMHEKWRVHRRRQLGITCALRVIAEEVAQQYTQDEIEALLSSSNDLLRWVAFSAFESLVHTDVRELAQLSTMPHLSSPERLQILEWMVSRAMRATPQTQQAIIGELLIALPQTISDSELSSMLDGLRGPLKRLFASVPWLCADIITPLIVQSRLTVDQVARAWLKDLLDIWTIARKGKSLLFRHYGEGGFTDEVSGFLALSGCDVKRELLKSLLGELKKTASAIRKPMASQIDFNAHDTELCICLWIASLLRVTLRRSKTPCEDEDVPLREALNESETLAASRAEADWERGHKELFDYWRRSK